MSDQSVGARAQFFGAGLLRRLGKLAGWQVVRRSLGRFWLMPQSGESIAAIDSRLLRDVGLSEFAADRAATSLYSQGLTEGFFAAGLGTLPGLLHMHGSDPDRSGVRIVCISGSDAP